MFHGPRRGLAIAAVLREHPYKPRAPRARNSMRALRNLLHALCTGYVACFFSERLFWTVLWPDATAGDLLLTWLAYSALAYLFLTVIHWSAAADWSSTFLAGSIYG